MCIRDSLFIIIGKLFICTLTVLCGYMIITRSETFKTKITSPIGPSICFAIVAYVIGAIYMAVYGVASEAILQCYLVEEEHGSVEKCPEEMRDFVENNAKK
eukprot:TRINITY_DN0_c2295_g1_i1.p1 TRINITY_DN0_c2295_g1~~TRINITY_DN0_c2295_g1_i1.p1  ORF type:complete len:101 (+),score=39.87 TRINITY_DN0_c2295_g1_i1:1-303(+)